MIAYPGYHGIEDYEPSREILEGFYDVVMRYEGSEVNVIYFSIQQKKQAYGGQAKNYKEVNCYLIILVKTKRLKLYKYLIKKIVKL